MTTHRDRMYEIVHRLLEKHSPPSTPPSDDPPAMQCQIRLRSGYGTQGVLSIVNRHDTAKTEHNALSLYETETLRLAAPGYMPDSQYPNNQTLAKKVIAEHFFDYEDLECVILLQEVDAKVAAGVDKPRIIMGG